MNDITIADVGPQLVLGIRQVGNFQMIPSLIGRLCQFVDEKKISVAGPPLFLCHEKTEAEVKKANETSTAIIEVAIPVHQTVAEEGDIKLYELPGGKMAKTIHRGPYENCKITYDKIFAWLEKNNEKITAPIREVYLNDPATVKPEEIITEIYVPI
jgi:effector-binding domain-containing protein